MSWQYNSNGNTYQTFDLWTGAFTMGVAGSPFGPIASGVSSVAGLYIPTQFTPSLGTAIRYGLGGGMDTYTYKDGSKSYNFSDGDEIIVDKNGKYIRSVHGSTPF